MIPDSIHRRKVYKEHSSSTCFSFHKKKTVICPITKFKKNNVEWNSYRRNSLVYGPTKSREIKERKNR